MKISMNYIIILVAVTTFVFGSYVSPDVQSFLYAVSLTVKECITFVLPLIIFSFLFGLVERLKVNAIKLLIIFFALLTVSNTFSISIASFIGRIVAASIDMGDISTSLLNSTKSLEPMWKIALPTLIPSQYLVVISIVVACIVSYAKPDFASKMNHILHKLALTILNKIILPVIPLFICGAIIKMVHDDLLVPVFKNYSVIFCIIIACSWGYMLLVSLFLMRNNFFIFLRNMLPTITTGFTTMSSNVAMPLLFKSIWNTTKKESLVDSLVPSATNFHLVGDCFIISILSTVIFYTFNGVLPSMGAQISFIAHFVVMSYAFVAIPGGGVIVMMPVLQNVLGFDSTMASLIITLYILFDPIGTASNLMGNGVFAIFLRKVMRV